VQSVYDEWSHGSQTKKTSYTGRATELAFPLLITAVINSPISIQIPAEKSLVGTCGGPTDANR
jgi:hypothetical protein